MSRLKNVAILLLMLTAVVCLSGCPILFPNPHDTEGEGESISGDEGESNTGDEGESLASNYKFVSALQGGQNAWDSNTDAAPGENSDATDNSGSEGTDAPRDVVEPDVVRRDGQLLYILNQYRGLIIVDLNTASIVAQVPISGYPRDLYLVGGRAYVLVSYAEDYQTDGNFVHINVGSKLYVVDISNPAVASVLGTPFALEGDFVDSRLVGDVLYAVNSRTEWQYTPVVTEGESSSGSGSGSSEGSTGSGVVSPPKPLKSTRPSTTSTSSSDAGTTGPSEPGWTVTQTSSSWVTSVDVSDPENVRVADTLQIDGYGSLIQATPSQAAHPALFVASTDWMWYGDEIKTTITYIDISNPAGSITKGDSIEVPGYLADRFKMDADGDVLRVVSSSGWRNGEVYLSTIDLSNPGLLTTLGVTKLAGASGESLFATRFDGERAYVVTYQSVDPLWIIDFSNPALPTVVGSLIVPGWSTHIEVRGNSLIALGVDDTNAQRRVKVSLFDVTDPAAPAEKSSLSFGDNWAWSSAYADVKSFTVLDDTIIVPVSGYDPVSYASKDTLQFIGYTADSLTLGGAVQLEGAAMRSSEYAPDQYYAVTSQELVLLTAADWLPVVQVRLPLMENVFDVQVLGPDVVAEIIVNDAGGVAKVRTETAAGVRIAETKVEITNLQATYVYGKTVVLVSSMWGWTYNDTTRQYTDKSSYDVAFVDCSDPAQPQAGTTIHVPIAPNWGGYYDGGIYPMMDAMSGKDVMAMGSGASVGLSDSAMYYPWWSVSTNNSMLTGHWLILRGTTSDGAYDVVLGSKTASQGFAKINLDAPSAANTVGLGYDNITGLNASGGQLYLGVQKNVGYDSYYRPLCAKMIAEINLDSNTIGPLSNVPGDFLAYDPTTDVLLLEDRQYSSDWSLELHLKTVDWDGISEAALLDEVQLPMNAYALTPKGGNVYFTHYENLGNMLGIARLGTDGRLSLNASVAATDAGLQLLDANGDVMFVVVGGSGIARYDCADAAQLLSVTPVTGNPLRIRFDETTAYAPLGYAGLARIPLELPK